MATIIKASIDLNKIPKDKIIVGKKGKYLPITITVNNEVDDYGNQGPVIVDQTKEERTSKADKVYLGNCKVVWTDGNNVDPAPYEAAGSGSSKSSQPEDDSDDLPF